MQIDVYDTYARAKNGNVIHFDVLLPKGAGQEAAIKFAGQFLETIGESADFLKQGICNFCHSEAASAEIEKSVTQSGHFILQMEGCPDPY